MTYIIQSNPYITEKCVLFYCLVFRMYWAIHQRKFWERAVMNLFTQKIEKIWWKVMTKVINNSYPSLCPVDFPVSILSFNKTFVFQLWKPEVRTYLWNSVSEINVALMWSSEQFASVFKIHLQTNQNTLSVTTPLLGNNQSYFETSSLGNKFNHICTFPTIGNLCANEQLYFFSVEIKVLMRTIKLYQRMVLGRQHRPH